MIQGKTDTGFEYAIDEEVLNDYELVEVIGEIDENPFAIAKVVKMLLGKEQQDALKDHCRNENGHVPMQRIEEEIVDILTSNHEIKN